MREKLTENQRCLEPKSLAGAHHYYDCGTMDRITRRLTRVTILVSDLMWAASPELHCNLSWGFPFKKMFAK